MTSESVFGFGRHGLLRSHELLLLLLLLHGHEFEGISASHRFPSRRRLTVALKRKYKYNVSVKPYMYVLGERTNGQKDGLLFVSVSIRANYTIVNEHENTRRND